MVAAPLAGDSEEVGVGRLAELPVRPDDHRVVAGEVAEPRAAGFGVAPGEAGLWSHVPSPPQLTPLHLPWFGRDAVEAPLGLVRALDGCTAREGGDLEVVGCEGRGTLGRQAVRRLERALARRGRLLAGLPDRRGNEIGELVDDGALRAAGGVAD